MGAGVCRLLRDWFTVPPAINVVPDKSNRKIKAVINSFFEWLGFKADPEPTPEEIQRRKSNAALAAYRSPHSSEMAALLLLDYPTYCQRIRTDAQTQSPQFNDKQLAEIVSRMSTWWFNSIAERLVKEMSIESLLDPKIPDGEHWPKFEKLCMSVASKRNGPYGSRQTLTKEQETVVINSWFSTFENACWSKVKTEMLGKHFTSK